MNEEQLLALGESLKLDFQCLIEKYTTGWLDDNYLTAEDLQELLAIELESYRFFEVAEEFLELDKWLSSGFIPTDLAAVNPDSAWNIETGESAAGSSWFSQVKSPEKTPQTRMDSLQSPHILPAIVNTIPDSKLCFQTPLSDLAPPLIPPWVKRDVRNGEEKSVKVPRDIKAQQLKSFPLKKGELGDTPPTAPIVGNNPKSQIPNPKLDDTQIIAIQPPVGSNSVPVSDQVSQVKPTKINDSTTQLTATSNETKNHSQLVEAADTLEHIQLIDQQEWVHLSPLAGEKEGKQQLNLPQPQGNEANPKSQIPNLKSIARSPLPPHSPIKGLRELASFLESQPTEAKTEMWPELLTQTETTGEEMATSYLSHTNQPETLTDLGLSDDVLETQQTAFPTSSEDGIYSEEKPTARLPLAPTSRAHPTKDENLFSPVLSQKSWDNRMLPKPESDFWQSPLTDNYSDSEIVAEPLGSVLPHLRKHGGKALRHKVQQQSADCERESADNTAMNNQEVPTPTNKIEQNKSVDFLDKFSPHPQPLSHKGPYAQILAPSLSHKGPYAQILALLPPGEKGWDEGETQTLARKQISHNSTSLLPTTPDNLPADVYFPQQQETEEAEFHVTEEPVVALAPSEISQLDMDLIVEAIAREINREYKRFYGD